MYVTVLVDDLVHDFLDRDVLIPSVLHGCGSHDAAIWRFDGDDISYIADALVVELQIAEVRLAHAQRDAQQLQDSLFRLAGCQRTHRGIDQVKLLLQVVEADRRIYAIPIECTGLVRIRCHKFAVDVLLVQNVEEGLVQF